MEYINGKKLQKLKSEKKIKTYYIKKGFVIENNCVKCYNKINYDNLGML